MKREGEEVIERKSYVREWMNRERKGKEGRSEWIRKRGMCGDEVCVDGKGMKGERNEEEEVKCEGISRSDSRRRREDNMKEM